MSDSIAAELRAPAGQRLSHRWFNGSVKCYHGRVSDLRQILPTFKRRPGRYGEHEIVAYRGSERIVGRVSPRYVLVQHHELLNALPEVLRNRPKITSGTTSDRD